MTEFKAPNDLERGEAVSWKWGQGHPRGEVVDAHKKSASIESKRGNTITKKGDDINPAVEIKQSSGNKVLKKASELNEVEIKE